MKLLFLFNYLFIFKDSNIINNNLPPCSRCIHYKNSFNNRLGKCTKFGQKDIITGKINYEYALDIRSDENKCGLKGNLFLPRKFPYNILDKICEDNQQK